MSAARKRQMARLEQLAVPHIKRLQSAAEERDRTIAALAWADAEGHAASLSLIILYGRPHIAEPLSAAWERCLVSEAAELSKLKKFRAVLDPFGDDLSLTMIVEIFRLHVLPTRAGSNDLQKISAIFASAPPWLLWFTFADLTAVIMDLTRPDLSSVEYRPRPRENFVRWPLLPKGIFVAGKRLSQAEIDEAERERKWMEEAIEKYPEDFVGYPKDLLQRKYRKVFDDYNRKNSSPLLK
jgi:hypothetical protein